MQTSEKGILALLAHEGVVPGPYLDSVGVWTYGVGHTKAAGHPIPKNMPRGMPANLHLELRNVFDVFCKDLERYENEVNSAITIDLAQHEFDAAVSFHYNTGAIARATWVKSLNAGNRAAAALQIMNWTKPAEIIERRKAEQLLFRGVYQPGKIRVWQINKKGRVIWEPALTLSPEAALAFMQRRGVSTPPDVEPVAPPATEIPKTSPLVAFFDALKRLFGG